MFQRKNLGLTVVQAEAFAEIECKTTQLTVVHAAKRSTLQIHVYAF